MSGLLIKKRRRSGGDFTGDDRRVSGEEISDISKLVERIGLHEIHFSEFSPNCVKILGGFEIETVLL